MSYTYSPANNGNTAQTGQIDLSNAGAINLTTATSATFRLGLGFGQGASAGHQRRIRPQWHARRRHQHAQYIRDPVEHLRQQPDHPAALRRDHRHQERAAARVLSRDEHPQGLAG